MQAIVLAAGMGRRMGKYTADCTKSMIEVGGKTLIQRVVESLKLVGINHLIMVIGYEGDKLREYVTENITDINVDYVYNHEYSTTNNIYSLFLARDFLANDDTILFESDLIFDERIVKRLVETGDENVVVVAKYEQWMDGTVVILDSNEHIVDFIDKSQFRYSDVDSYYKTVNIYKFSRNFSENQYIPFLEAYLRAYGTNQYYEQVLKALAHIKSSELKAMILDKEKWYELDDAQDLDIANTIFASNTDILEKYEKHYGGYWRFPRLKDFCYLVNPYYPPQKMINQMKYFFGELLTQYPSGMSIQRLNTESMFGVDEKYVLVGNGAAELIGALGRVVDGRILLQVPTFNEYKRCFKKCEFIKIAGEEYRYKLVKEAFLKRIEECDTVLFINPDNPSGGFLCYEDMIDILNVCKANGKNCIVDESFIDFAESEKRYTLLENSILEKYKNLVVIKSISKSYGIPGIRLGILATANEELLKKIKEELSIWNINSYAEYYLQIQRLYKRTYIAACDKIAEQRKWLSEKLSEFEELKVYPSQANYIMCAVEGGITSEELATKLVSEYDVLIKNLSKKDGFSGKSFIRIAVKNEEDNRCLIDALKNVFGEKR